MALMVTGGTGFLGSYLTRHLVQEKGLTDVVLFEQFPNYDRIAEVRDRVTLVLGDIRAPQEILGAMKKYDVDRVIHLGAILEGPGDPSKAIAYLEVNSMGTANIFDAALTVGVKRVVYASTAGVLGDVRTDEEVDEDFTPAVQNSFYSTSKLWGEHIAAVYRERYGLDTIGLRPCSVMGLGRGQRGSYASGLATIRDYVHFMVLPEVAALGHPVEMPPDDQVYDWIYAADAAEAWYCALVAENPPHRVFNMRAERRPIGDFTAHLRRLLPDAEITVGTKRAFDFPLMKNDRLVNELGFRPRYTIETGLEDYLERFLRQEGREPALARLRSHLDR